MGEDGTIGKIPQTLQGRRQLSYVDPYAQNRAANFAVMGGIACVASDDGAKQYGSGNMALGEIDTGDFVVVKGVDFGEETPVKWSASVRNPKGEEGVIRICADGPDGTVLGYLPVTDPAEEFTEYTVSLDRAVTGVHDLCLVFSGEGYELESWQFHKE